MFSNPVIWLSIVTLLAALGFGFWQVQSVWRVQRRRGGAKHAHYAMDTSTHEDERAGR